MYGTSNEVGITVNHWPVGHLRALTGVDGTCLHVIVSDVRDGVDLCTQESPSGTGRQGQTSHLALLRRAAKLLLRRRHPEHLPQLSDAETVLHCRTLLRSV